MNTVMDHAAAPEAAKNAHRHRASRQRYQKATEDDKSPSSAGCAPQGLFMPFEISGRWVIAGEEQKTTRKNEERPSWPDWVSSGKLTDSGDSNSDSNFGDRKEQTWQRRMGHIHLSDSYVVKGDDLIGSSWESSDSSDNSCHHEINEERDKVRERGAGIQHLVGRLSSPSSSSSLEASFSDNEDMQKVYSVDEKFPHEVPFTLTAASANDRSSPMASTCDGGNIPEPKGASTPETDEYSSSSEVKSLKFSSFSTMEEDEGDNYIAEESIGVGILTPSGKEQFGYSQAQQADERNFSESRPSYLSQGEPSQSNIYVMEKSTTQKKALNRRGVGSDSFDDIHQESRIGLQHVELVNEGLPVQHKVAIPSKDDRERVSANNLLGTLSDRPILLRGECPDERNCSRAIEIDRTSVSSASQGSRGSTSGVVKREAVDEALGQDHFNAQGTNSGGGKPPTQREHEPDHPPTWQKEEQKIATQAVSAANASTDIGNERAVDRPNDAANRAHPTQIGGDESIAESIEERAPPFAQIGPGFLERAPSVSSIRLRAAMLLSRAEESIRQSSSSSLPSPLTATGGEKSSSAGRTLVSLLQGSHYGTAGGRRRGEDIQPGASVTWAAGGALREDPEPPVGVRRRSAPHSLFSREEEEGSSCPTVLPRPEPGLLRRFRTHGSTRRLVAEVMRAEEGNLDLMNVHLEIDQAKLDARVASRSRAALWGEVERLSDDHAVLVRRREGAKEEKDSVAAERNMLKNLADG
eukprot:CAMPEP_0113554438 /NCGR_PEP_ID=MMETSP0015_2-20120614/16149_1 /TAXON_ID=2838 /ORGANISM="Odontella" /LENGTH=751 /DNA_ID=CAMNT_0000455579 /DNA_START=185 /DNA_END=2437 /DNA_ORIENTATION=+ /assembly_acc=CAM_ASM_000160